MQDSENTRSNLSGNVDLDQIVAARRDILRGALASAASFFAAGCSFESPSDEPELTSTPGELRGKPLLGFREVPISSADTLVVPPGYSFQVIVPWGTPLFENSPEFAEDASNSAADQALQVGFNHDGMHYFPLLQAGDRDAGNRRGLLVINHEYTDENQIYTAQQGSAITPDEAGREKVAKALAAHGLTIVEVVQGRHGEWRHVIGSRYNRRVTGTTPMAFSGPVGQHHPALASSVTPRALGTLNNCANGVTPWGTYLICEENWNGYFGTTSSTWTRSPEHQRYGISAGGSEYNWHLAEPRFDLASNPNEVNRFGWVVEVDPFDRRSTPVKRTALGRIKHEGATCTESKGRVVVYMGDDQNGEYLYKFVGDAPWRRVRARGKCPLDSGTLYVAKFEADGRGVWLPLVHGTGPLVTQNGWVDQADVLLRTRLAADALGATPLHRPEWVAVHPKTGEVFVTLTNGSGNAAAVNSGRDPNPYGHILRLKESAASDGDFAWDVFLVAGDPAYDSTLPTTQSAFGSPDGLWIDPDGRMWIQTDVSNSSQNLASRGYDGIGNNQMLAADPRTGQVRRFLTGPRGCEITGVTATPDGTSLFINIQHPGESSVYWNSQFGAPSPATPSTVSSWPFGGRPRPATVVIRKLDGGKIGT